MLSPSGVAIVDDVAAARSTAALLEQSGYRVGTFESGDAFLATQIPGDWDCVVLDLRTAGLGGMGLLQALGAWEKAPPVLVLTGEGAIAEAVEAMKLGAADFLEKPYPAEAFLEAVNRALAAKARRAVDSEAAARIAALPQRQVQVLRGMLRGQPNKIIAWELSLSIRTIESYRASLLEKLGVRGTAAAVRLAISAGMLETS